MTVSIVYEYIVFTIQVSIFSLLNKVINCLRFIWSEFVHPTLENNIEICIIYNTDKNAINNSENNEYCFMQVTNHYH